MKHPPEIGCAAVLIVVLHLMVGCVHRKPAADVSSIESRLREITLIAPSPPPPRVIRWDAADDIPREKMVWIEVLNGAPRARESKEPIPDVTAYVNRAAARLGEVWVVVQRIHVKMQPDEKDREVIQACERSRARAVILPDRIYLGAGRRGILPIYSRRFAKLPDWRKIRDGKAVQPVARANDLDPTFPQDLMEAALVPFEQCSSIRLDLIEPIVDVSMYPSGVALDHIYPDALIVDQYRVTGSRDLAFILSVLLHAGAHRDPKEGQAQDAFDPLGEDQFRRETCFFPTLRIVFEGAADFSLEVDTHDGEIVATTRGLSAAYHSEPRPFQSLRRLAQLLGENTAQPSGTNNIDDAQRGRDD